MGSAGPTLLERTIEHALASAERRIDAHDDERSVLVHGDVHQWNALEADGGYGSADPDGLLAEAEYDMGVLMREDPLELWTGIHITGPDGSPDGAAWTPTPSGSGASWNGCRPGSS